MLVVLFLGVGAALTLGIVRGANLFFEEVHYTPQTWAEGVRELPRMYLTAIGERWKQRTQNELTVQAKKRIFFRPTAGRATETPSSNRFLALISAAAAITLGWRSNSR